MIEPIVSIRLSGTTSNKFKGCRVRSTVAFYFLHQGTLRPFQSLVRTHMRGLGLPFHHTTRTLDAFSARSAHIPRVSNTRTSIVRATALKSATDPRKTTAHRVQSASRGYPKPPGSLPASKAATSAGHEPTREEHGSAGVPRAVLRDAKREHGPSWSLEGWPRAHALRLTEGPASATTKSFRPLLLDEFDAGSAPRAPGRAPSTYDSRRPRRTMRKRPRRQP